MKLEAPPSRYRVVERGGRLVVIDSVAGGVPPKARELVPVSIEHPRDPEGGDNQRGDPEPQVAAPLTLDSRVRGNTEETTAPPRISLTPEAPGLLRNVAATVCSDARDRDGRLQWTTAGWFDARGPRTVTLTQRTEEQLGLATLALLIGAFAAVILAVAFGFIGWVILIIAVTTLPKAKPAVTAWIDRLGRR